MESNLAIRSAEDRLPVERSPATGTRRLTAHQQAAQARAERQADIIQDAAFPASMAAAIPLSKEVGASGFKIYLDRLLKDAGNPTDPIERMMIEQLAMAHHRIAQLHVQTETADTVEGKKAYAAAAVRLTGEFRRLSLAIRQYRQPISTKHFTVVRQQNIANGDQQVAYLDQSGAGRGQNKVPSLHSGREQESNRLADARTRPLSSESETSRGRPQEPAEARPVYTGGPGEAAAVGIEEQGMGEIDWTHDA